MAGRKKTKRGERKLSVAEAKAVARDLQRKAASSHAGSRASISLKSTATGKGEVVFHASRVLSRFAEKASTKGSAKRRAAG
jgi:hypothetical protein